LAPRPVNEVSAVERAATPVPRRWSPGRLLADRSLRAKGVLVVAIPLVALGCGLGMAARARDDGLAATEQVAASLEVQKQLANVRNLAVDSETGVRGWLLTADPTFLGPYEQARLRLRPEVDQLAALVAGRPTQRARAEELRWLSIDQFAQSEGLRALDPLGDRGRIELALKAGRAATDAVRAGIDAMNQAEEAELASLRAIAEQSDRRARLAMAALLVAGVAGAAAALAVFIRSISRRVELLRDNAAALAEGRPMRSVPAGSDEIAELGHRMAEAADLMQRRDQELRSAMGLAEQANRAKTEFLSRVSHELRTPLNAMLGFAQILDMEELSDNQHDDVNQILRGGRHLLGLINEVLDISRIETGDLAMSLEPVLLADVTGEVARLLQSLAGRRQVRLIVDPTVGQAGLVRGDRQRLSQILMNLVSNAIKYNVEDGTVTVAAAQPRPNVVRVTVTDTGPGISPENLELLFAPFERLGAERTTVEGTGIGLALSRRLAEAMGGTLAVESRLGRGSTFWLEVPAAFDAYDGGEVLVGAAPAAVPAEPRPTAPGGAGPGAAATIERGSIGTAPGRSLVLCIDDNSANLKVVEAALSRLPWVDVVSAETGRHGLELARRHRPDLVLLDLHLPDLTGEDVMRIMRTSSATAGIPVVVVSADATPGAIRRLLDKGAVAYLTKPLSVRQLLECVREHAPSRSAVVGARRH
jgi:signal transduction histidine kinase/ActR/RegA family two-component response regulator